MQQGDPIFKQWWRAPDYLSLNIYPLRATSFEVPRTEGLVVSSGALGKGSRRDEFTTLRCVELFYDMTPVVMPWYLLPVTWNLRASVLLLRETH